MGDLAQEEILAFFNKLSQYYDSPANIYLLGGSALCLLGSPRRTIDIDITLDSSLENKIELDEAIKSVADKMHLELEIIPISEFIPVPDGSHLRHRLIERIGSMSLYVFDPYTISISKIARGFETDLQDVLYLLRNGIVEINRLNEFVEQTIPVAWEYDIDPAEMKNYFAEVKKHLSSGASISP
ncbi:MAG: DUF6036 family nucleotidyltransferase [Chloroflexota bacterium]|nr:DUF6036 family nucleotidyltransferase [Chloroflexota bacterium]